jgi:hypothetical protein
VYYHCNTPEQEQLQAQILAEPSARSVCFPLNTARADAMKIVIARRGQRLGFEP